MIGDVLRFQKQAPRDLPTLERTGETLNAYLDRSGYGRLFRDAHLLPQAAAIWSCDPGPDDRLSGRRPSCAST